jgi:hypothetical protein
LKRALNNLPPLSEEEFDVLLEKQSIESISGSDEDEEEEEEEQSTSEIDLQNARLQSLMKKLSIQNDDDDDNNSSISHLNTKSPFLLFKANDIPENKVLAVYKSLFNESELLKTPLESLKSFTSVHKSGKSALFMIGGGHFAGAIISHVAKDTRGNVSRTESKAEQAVNIIVSKTFHRYTVRKKQGGSQSASDNARGKANSAGSSIRRYNEQALMKEVRELLVEWKHHLAECSSIFIRANGAANRRILVGYPDAVISNDDKRLKGFPFTTKRATTSELKRAWVELSYLKIVDMPKVNQKAINKKLKSPSPHESKASTIKEAPSENDKHTTELVGLIKRQKAPKLITYIKQHKIDVNEFRLTPELLYVQYPTLLHYAASNGLTHIVQVLLVNLNSDPTVQNIFSKTPAEIAEKNTRKTFQIVRQKLGESAHDWKAAKVGPPRSKEDIEKEEKEEEQKLKSEKQRLIQEQLDRKTELELKKPTFQSSGTTGGNPPFKVNELSGLSEQQQMRLMREQRARAAEARLRQSK